MKKFEVKVDSLEDDITLTIEAENEDEAFDKATEQLHKANVMYYDLHVYEVEEEEK